MASTDHQGFRAPFVPGPEIHFNDYVQYECVGSRSKQIMSDQETFDAVVGKAADLIAQLHIPGLSVGVIHGANSYATGIGVTNVSTKEPVTADTEFHIASVTKTFTATLAMMLSEQGVLDLNARIIDILPWFRVKDPEATAKASAESPGDRWRSSARWKGHDPVASPSRGLR